MPSPRLSYLISALIVLLAQHASAALPREYLCFAQCARIDTEQNTVSLLGAVIGTSRASRAQALRNAAARCGSGTLVQDVIFSGSSQSHRGSEQGSAQGRSRTYPLDYDHSWQSDRRTWHFCREGETRFTLRLLVPSDCTWEVVAADSPPPPYGVGQPVYP